MPLFRFLFLKNSVNPIKSTEVQFECAPVSAQGRFRAIPTLDHRWDKETGNVSRMIDARCSFLSELTSFGWTKKKSWGKKQGQRYAHNGQLCGTRDFSGLVTRRFRNRIITQNRWFRNCRLTMRARADTYRTPKERRRPACPKVAPFDELSRWLKPGLRTCIVWGHGLKTDPTIGNESIRTGRWLRLRLRWYRRRCRCTWLWRTSGRPQKWRDTCGSRTTYRRTVQRDITIKNRWINRVNVGGTSVEVPLRSQRFTVAYVPVCGRHFIREGKRMET